MNPKLAMNKLAISGKYILAIAMGMLMYNCSDDDSLGVKRIIVEEEEVEKVGIELETIDNTEEGRVFSIVNFENPLELNPGDNIQDAIDELREDGGSILLGKGTYVLSTALVVYSNINIHGYSADDPSGTIITIEDNTYNQPIIKNRGGLYNVSLQNFKVQGNLLDSEQHLDPSYHTDGTAGEDDSIRNDFIGILLSDGGDTYNGAEISNIKMRNIEVSNCSMGIHIKGAREVYLTDMNLHDNGMIEAYYHNLYFRRCFKFTISNSKMHNSPTGNGMNVSQSEDVTLRNNNCYSNFFRGLRVEGESGYVVNKITIENNICTDNSGIGFRLNNITAGRVENNSSTGNGEDTYFGSIGEGVIFTGNSWD